jgi:membrane protease YdiL (CAAX protease family)
MNTLQISRLSAFVRRHQIHFFFILAFALSWLVWGSAIAQHYGLLDFQIPDLLAYFGVSLAASIVAGLADGWEGIRNLLRRLIRWRVGLAWYAIVLLLPILLPSLTAFIYELFGGSVSVGSVLPLERAVAYFFFGIPFMLLTEETAWRGFALPRLEAKYGTWKASLLLGLLWGVWHTPYFLLPGSSQSNFPYVAYILMVMAQSVMYGWIHHKTGGSVLMAALFHAATNAALAYVGVGVGDPRAFWLLTAVTWVAAISVAWAGSLADKLFLPRRQNSSSMAS